MTTATKALPDFRQIFRRIQQGLNYILPRQLTPAEIAERQEARKPLTQRQQEAARAALEKYRVRFNEEAKTLGTQVASGEITPREFRVLMLTEIRMLLFTGAAAGVGGVGNLKPADIDRVDQKVREQAVYLDRWVSQIERTPVDQRSAGQFSTRATMYGGAGTTLLSETIDKTEFREFPDMPFYPAQKTKCLSACACDWIWRNVDPENGNADVYYTMNVKRRVKEHCKTCIKRRQDFYPLRIRNWDFQNLPADLSPYLDE